MRCTENAKNFAHEFYIWVCRVWGIGTAVGLWGVGVETAWRHHSLSIYLLILAGLFSILEVLFVVQFWIQLHNSESSCCGRITSWLSLLDGWKKAVFYLFLSIGCFVQPSTVKLAIISGVMIVICSLLNFLKSYLMIIKERNTQSLMKTPTFDRFDDLPEDLEELGLDRSTNQIVRSPSQDFQVESLADQDQILEV